MSEFCIGSTSSLIVKAKLKFAALGFIIFIVNSIFVYKYVELAMSGESQGLYFVVFAFVNLPFYVLSIILMLTPLLYQSYYKKMSYCFSGDELTIKTNRFVQRFKSTEIEQMHISLDGYHSRVMVRAKNVSRIFQLEGVQDQDCEQLMKWCEVYHIEIHIPNT